MGNVLTMRGAVGSLEWGYHRAAVVTDFTVTTVPEGLQLIGTVSEINTFRLAQEPLTFRVARSTGPAWTWPIRALHITDRSLTAMLVPHKR